MKKLGGVDMKKSVYKICVFIICLILACLLFGEAPKFNKQEQSIIRNPQANIIDIPMVTIPKTAVEGWINNGISGYRYIEKNKLSP